MKILREIKSGIEYMSNAERKIAEAILKDPESFVRVSLGEFSAYAQVSQGSVVNFAGKYCGGGFTNLKQAVALDLDGNNENELLADNASLAKCANNMCEALMNTVAVNSQEIIDEAVQVLLGAKKVEIYGIYRSAAVATDFYFRLLEIGIPANFVSDVLTCAVSASLLGKGDVVVAISSSGQTRDVIDAIELAKANGAYILSITAHRNSPIALLSDTVLASLPSGNERLGDSTQIRVSQLAVTDAICAGLKTAGEDLRKNQIKKILNMHAVRE